MDCSIYFNCGKMVVPTSEVGKSDIGGDGGPGQGYKSNGEQKGINKLTIPTIKEFFKM